MLPLLVVCALAAAPIDAVDLAHGGLVVEHQRPVPMAPPELLPPGLPPLPTLPIVNGTVDSSNRLDNVVALGFGDSRYDYGFFCSGSLIDDTWVLTAAHCVEGAWDYQGYGLSPYIYVGASENNYRQRVKVKRTIEHPSYQGGPNVVPYDIAVAELDDRITGIDFMVLSETKPAINLVLTFAGYGITSYQGQAGGGTKRYTEIPVVQFSNPDYYTSYDPNTNVCSGDSGGPSFEEFPEGRVQYGVNRSVGSYNSELCAGGWNDSTRVDYHLDWIQGYVPNALTDFPDDSDTDTDTDTDSDTDADADADSDADGDFEPGGIPNDFVDFEEDELDDPLRPEKGLYGSGIRCATGPGWGGGLFLVLVASLSARRRR